MNADTQRMEGSWSCLLGYHGTTARTTPRLREALVYMYGFIIKDKLGHIRMKKMHRAECVGWGGGSLIPSSGTSLHQRLRMLPD